MVSSAHCIAAVPEIFCLSVHSMIMSVFATISQTAASNRRPCFDGLNNQHWRVQRLQSAYGFCRQLPANVTLRCTIEKQNLNVLKLKISECERTAEVSMSIASHQCSRCLLGHGKCSNIDFRAYNGSNPFADSVFR